jgi:hypothetical protein
VELARYRRWLLRAHWESLALTLSLVLTLPPSLSHTLSLSHLPSLILSPGGHAGAAVNRSWDGGSAPPQPLFVPAHFRGVSDLRPMAWGSASTSSGQMLRQVERLGVTTTHPGAAPAPHQRGTATWGPYDAAPMHGMPDPSSMLMPERLAMKPVLAYEKTQDGRVKTKESSWQEGVAQHGDGGKVVREIMHLLWSDYPPSQLATNLESLSSLQRHSVLEIVIGLMRNTGVFPNFPSGTSRTNLASALGLLSRWRLSKP